MILSFKKRIQVGLIPIQTIAFINEQFIFIRHIDDVITSFKRGFEMGDHLQIEGKTSLKILI